MDYERDLFQYNLKARYNLKVKPPTDTRTIYGGDTIVFTIITANKGFDSVSGIIVNDVLSSKLQFMNCHSTQGSYDENSGTWNIGDLGSGASATLKIPAKVLKDGEIENSAILHEPSSDSNPSNNQANVRITAKPPVIFVHGWRGSPETWIDFSKEFLTEGIRYYIYDYSPGLLDPATQSFHFEYWINNKIRTTENYQGRFDIVCHSMGALVSRFYIEANKDNAANVRKWIGIAPVNHGAALADLESLFPEKSIIRNILTKFFPDLKKDSGAIVHMRTDDDETLSIEDNTFGKNAHIQYSVIMGKLGSNSTITPLDVTKWTKDLKYLLSARAHYLLSLFSLLYRKTNTQTIIKITDSQYGLTWLGDGAVANEQSKLDCAINYEPILGLDHNAITRNQNVIRMVENILNN